MLSIVIPVYNEEESVVALLLEILEMLKSLETESEIIVVDDGSTDQTARVAKAFSEVKLISLRKNFGQTAALNAGIKMSSGEYIVTLDGDGQNDPYAIPTMLQILKENDLDLVCGWRKQRKDKFLKKITSLGARKLRLMFFNDPIHDSGCTLKVFKAVSIKEIPLYGEMHRFIPAIMIMRGFRVSETIVQHRPRKAGTTKYNWRRIPRSIFDMFGLWFWNKFAARPLHLFGFAGLSCVALGAAFSMWGLFLHLSGSSLFRYSLPIGVVLLFTTGIQLLLTGLIADKIGKISFENTSEKSYYIREVL